MKQCRRLWYNEREMTDMNKDILADEIFSRYGAITRARGCFLYTKKTVRLTDMFREGGAAILGWGGGSAFTMLKNTLNRGITGTFRTEFHPQLIRAVSLLLDNQKNTRTLRVFRSLSALRAECGEDVAIYTPFDPDNTDYSTKDAVAVVPPLPWVSPSYALLAVKANSPRLLGEGSGVRSSGESLLSIPAPMAAGMCRAIYDVIKAQGEWREQDFFLYDPVLTKYWTRRGCYLFPKVSRERYADFVRHCLDCAIVISPDYDTPSLVPFGADRGVFTALKSKPFEAER